MAPDLSQGWVKCAELTHTQPSRRFALSRILDLLAFPGCDSKETIKCIAVSPQLLGLSRAKFLAVLLNAQDISSNNRKMSNDKGLVIPHWCLAATHDVSDGCSNTSLTASRNEHF